ncbi:MAG: hypothetical protein LLF28_06640 [Nitrospiraceae bacterium]|nr:hypothetical protein [Nitrospiraceae bacterium]
MERSRVLPKSHIFPKWNNLYFLLMIGFTLIAEGFDVHVPKGYIYFAMAFSVGVEMLNIRVRRKKETETIRLNKNISENGVV